MKKMKLMYPDTRVFDSSPSERNVRIEICISKTGRHLKIYDFDGLALETRKSEMLQAI